MVWGMVWCEGGRWVVRRVGGWRVGVWMVGGWEGGWCGDGGRMEGRGVGMVGGWEGG